MVPSNAYHYIGGPGSELWGQLGSCKDEKRESEWRQKTLRTKTESKERLLSSLPSVDS